MFEDYFDMDWRQLVAIVVLLLTVNGSLLLWNCDSYACRWWFKILVALPSSVLILYIVRYGWSR